MTQSRGLMPAVGLLGVVGLLVFGDIAVRTGRAQSQGGAPRAVVAQEFRLIDATGNPRAVLGMSADGGPALIFRDKQGRNRAAISVAEDQSSLALLDAEGHTRVRITLQDDGAAGIALHDKKQKLRAALRLKADGTPNLSFNDSDGKSRAGIETQPDGSPLLSLSNKDETGGAVMFVLPNGDTRAIFKDKDGKVTWIAPEPEIEIKKQ